MIGKTISHYKILGKVGEGGMGVVYRAKDLTLKREVALKFLPFHALDDTEQRTRLVREAQAAAALEHININTVYEIDEDDGRTFMAMAFVDGKDLKQVNREGLQPLETVLSIGIQIATGLNKAHENDIVHRDVKPANVLLTEEGIVKLVDFGLAKLAGATGLTKSDSTVGTAAYMSPEQAQGQIVDHRTDIWSLGVILYELLTGQRPFRGEHDAVTLYSIVTDDFAPISESRSDVPAELEQIVTKALAKKPSHRYNTMAEMLQDLRGLLGETPADVTGSQPSQLRLRRKPLRRRPPVQFAAAAVLVIIAVSVLYLLTRPSTPVAPAPTTDEIPDAQEEVEIPYAPHSPAVFALDIIRGPDSTALAATVADSAAEAVAAVAGSLLVPRIPTIAVLCLDDLGSDNQDDYFATALTDEIIHTLSQIDSLRVFGIPRASRFHEGDHAIPGIGALEGVDFILEASVARDREQLRIRAHLVKADDSTIALNNRYDRLLSEVFDVRSEIATDVAKAVDVNYTVEEFERMMSKPTADLEAYDLYLQGRVLGRRHLEADNKNAEKQLRKALKNDRRFAGAMIALASVYIDRVRWGIDFNPEWMAEANSLLNQASGIESAQAELQTALADWRLVAGDYAGAIQAAHRAAEIDRNNFQAHLRLGIAAHGSGQRDSAKASLVRSLEIKPNCAEAHVQLARLAHEDRRTTVADSHMRKALAFAPESAGIQAAAGEYYLERGEIAAALGAFVAASQIEPESPVFKGKVAVATLHSGQPDAALHPLDNVAADTKQPWFYWYLGWAHALQGDDKDAKRAFEKALQMDLVQLQINPADLEAAYRTLWERCLLESGFQDVQGEIDRLAKLPFVSSKPGTRELLIAGAYAAAGDRATAIEELRKALERGYYDPNYVATHPGFSAMRSETAFRKLLGIDTSN